MSASGAKCVVAPVPRPILTATMLLFTLTHMFRECRCCDHCGTPDCRLDKFLANNVVDKLECVTGAGNGSPNGKSKIKPAVHAEVCVSQTIAELFCDLSALVDTSNDHSNTLKFTVEGRYGICVQYRYLCC